MMTNEKPTPRTLTKSEILDGKRLPQKTTHVRAISEDDDGYDPYTDQHDGTMPSADGTCDPYEGIS
jgi:hypothetical protein